MVTSQEVVKKLKAMANPKNVEGMARFGMAGNGRLGIAIPKLRDLAKEIGKNHVLASELYKAPYKEAKILAGFIEEIDKITEKQMDEWVKDFDSWDVCDQLCFVFDRTAFAFPKAKEWAKRDEEFVKRAGFALIAGLAVHNKQAKDSQFEKFFSLIKKYPTDERNFVRKAINWALREIGKRNENLNGLAITLAKDIQKIDNKTARWIANDALRELTSPAVQKRLKVC